MSRRREASTWRRRNGMFARSAGVAWLLAALGAIESCCVTAAPMGTYESSTDVVNTMTGCTVPPNAEEISVYVDSYMNTIVDSRFDVSSEDAEEFFDCWRSGGGTVGDASQMRDGNFGDHREPRFSSGHARAGELRIGSPTPGLCEMVSGGSPVSTRTRIYLRCTVDGVLSERLGRR